MSGWRSGPTRCAAAPTTASSCARRKVREVLEHYRPDVIESPVPTSCRGPRSITAANIRRRPWSPATTPIFPMPMSTGWAAKWPARPSPRRALADDGLCRDHLSRVRPGLHAGRGGEGDARARARSNRVDVLDLGIDLAQLRSRQARSAFPRATGPRRGRPAADLCRADRQ